MGRVAVPQPLVNLRRPKGPNAWFRYEPGTGVGERDIVFDGVRWSWWAPLGWVWEQRFSDGSCSRTT